MILVIKMRLKHIKGAKEMVESSSYVVQDPILYRGKMHLLFPQKNPIHLEIGMGKGNFLLESARRNPDINYIGIEKYDSVLVRALEKLESMPLSNIKFFCIDASVIHTLFDREIDLLYLNFSDPWPKARHFKRRLTSFSFLTKYDSIFKGTKRIIQKTDNRKLFEFSIQSFTDYGYHIESICLDLYKEDLSSNIPTEYEQKFSSKGFPIYQMEVTKK